MIFLEVEYLTLNNFRRASNTNLEDLSNIVEDEDASNPEENSEYFLAIIIECLAVLNKIPEAVEVPFF